MKLLKEMFSDAQGILDEARIAAFLIVLAFVVSTVYAVYTSRVFNAQEFGIGAGAMAAGIGAWFGIRKDN